MQVDLLNKLEAEEHLTTQLALETDTIAQYIELYHTQRNALSIYVREKEKYG
jgi:hypothetical protein